MVAPVPPEAEEEGEQQRQRRQREEHRGRHRQRGGDDGVGAEHESEEQVGFTLLEGDHEGVPALTEADGLVDEMLRHVKGGGQR